MPEQSFGPFARQARVKARVSLRQVATALGWSPVYVSDIERGVRNPPAANKIIQWANLIQVDPKGFLRLAMQGRESLEIPVRDPELLSVLARRLDHLTPDQRDRVIDILEEGEE